MWRSDDDRENRQSYGIANEIVRKLISGNDSANKAAKTDGVLDATIAGMCDRMKIPLGKILCDHGPYASYKFACVIDFRTVDDDTISGSSRKLVETQAGILMQIEKETTNRT